MKTEYVKLNELERKWWIVDAQDLVLGRLASELARRLKGKDKAQYSPHMDVGDHYVVINADKIRVTGRKLTDKMYYHHTGYPGGIKSRSLEKLLAHKPEEVLELAVKRMLPKNPLGYAMFRKLKVYAGTSHPHQAQQPQVLEIKEAE